MTYDRGNKTVDTQRHEMQFFADLLVIIVCQVFVNFIIFYNK